MSRLMAAPRILILFFYIQRLYLRLLSWPSILMLLMKLLPTLQQIKTVFKGSVFALLLIQRCLLGCHISMQHNEALLGCVVFLKMTGSLQILNRQKQSIRAASLYVQV